MEWAREREWYQPTWFNDLMNWLRKEKRIWREKCKARRRSDQDAINKKKISWNFRQNKKTQGWIWKEDTQEYQLYHEFFSWEIWNRARVSKRRTEAMEAINEESNSTITECPVGPTSSTFYATAARFVDNETRSWGIAVPLTKNKTFFFLIMHIYQL